MNKQIFCCKQDKLNTKASLKDDETKNCMVERILELVDIMYC